MKLIIAVLLLVSLLFVGMIQDTFGSTDHEMKELLSKLEVANEDTSKVDLLIKLFKLTSSADVKSSLDYANEALILSKKLNYEKGIAISNYSLALIFVDYDFKFSEELII